MGNNVASITNLILASATFITALASLVKVSKTKTKVEKSVVKLDNVEQLVNGKHDAALARNDQLVETLASAGVPIPAPPMKDSGDTNAI